MYNEIDLDAIDTTQEPPTEEPARQYYFMAKCREWVREFERKNGRRPFAFTQTFGWGEGFEQREIKTEEGELCVSFWHSGDDFFIKTEQELKQWQTQDQGMQMGGIG